eukprot:GSMAST32.ASY1.ANO1.1039.1 assembled CDS
MKNNITVKKIQQNYSSRLHTNSSLISLKLVVKTLTALLCVCWFWRPPQLVALISSFVDSVRMGHLAELVIAFNVFLEKTGVPGPFPSAEQYILVLVGFVICTTSRFLLYQRGQYYKSYNTDQEISALCHHIKELQEVVKTNEHLKLRASVSGGSKGQKPVRIFMEGAFDLMHYGHMNAFRLGASLADNVELIVGVNSSASITECKGNVPYVMSEKYLNMVMEKYSIDYIVHGDDPVIVNGKDVYRHVKSMGKYRCITEGVSTTDIVGRMLLCSTHNKSSSFYTTSSLLRSFAKDSQIKPDGAKVVYIDGTWDMFHV